MKAPKKTPRSVGILLAILGFLVVVWAAGWLAGPQTVEESEYDKNSMREATLVRVVDGDTIDVRLADGTNESVRLIGIDAPEIEWEEDADDESECYGWDAREKLIAILSDHELALAPDSTQPDRDTYDRLLRYVLIVEGEGETRNVNIELLEAGAAQELTVGSEYEYRDDFLKATQRAQVENRGLWGVCPSVTFAIQ